jgi:hypothetical protein
MPNLQAQTKEKVYKIAGPEFGELQGQRVLIVRALYGLKSSCAAWHDHFSNTLFDMSFHPSYGDSDVWMRPAINPYVSVCTILIVSGDIIKSSTSSTNFYFLLHLNHPFNINLILY